MDFDLSEEQRLLKDSIERLLADRYGFEARRRHQAEPDGWSREMWARFAELGLLGLPFAEEHGGFGGGPVETGLVMEAFGRALVDRAALDALLKLRGAGFWAGMRANIGGLAPHPVAPDLPGFDFDAMLAGLPPLRRLRARGGTPPLVILRRQGR